MTIKFAWSGSYAANAARLSALAERPGNTLEEKQCIYANLQQLAQLVQLEIETYQRQNFVAGWLINTQAKIAKAQAIVSQ